MNSTCISYQLFASIWKPHLLVPGYRIHQLHIKLWIVLSKRLMAVVVYQLHDRIKC